MNDDTNKSFSQIIKEFNLSGVEITLFNTLIKRIIFCPDKPSSILVVEKILEQFKQESCVRRAVEAFIKTL